MIKFKLEGAEQAAKLSRALVEAAAPAMADAANKAVSKIARESMEECPVDTGHLRLSQRIQFSTYRTMKGVQEASPAVIKYNADYAFYVHENLTAKHEVGKAKFLEDPVSRGLPDYLKKCEAAVAAAWRKLSSKVKKGGGL